MPPLHPCLGFSCIHLCYQPRCSILQPCVQSRYQWEEGNDEYALEEDHVYGMGIGDLRSCVRLACGALKGEVVESGASGGSGPCCRTSAAPPAAVPALRPERLGAARGLPALLALDRGPGLSGGRRGDSR